MAHYRSVDYQASRSLALNAFMRGVYGWMFAGLLVTAVVSLFVVSSPAIMQTVFQNQMLFFALIIGELALVAGLSMAINRISGTTATLLFMLYSALNGVTLSFIFIVYTQASIVNAFLVAAGMFGAMSVYGVVTKKDLTSWGSFLFMGLIGIVIASLVNIFLASSAMSFVISCIGVLVFTGLTAYDTQRLRVMGETAPAGDGTVVRRATILGALTLYLDFINLFLMLLRLFGGSRD